MTKIFNAENVMLGKTGDISVQAPRIDKSTHSLQTIEYEHHEIHSGSHYFIEGHAILANLGTLYSKIVTPNTGKWAHFAWNISSNGILDSNFYEIPTGGMANGARATIHANNRNINCWSGRHTTGASAAVLVDTGQAWTIDELKDKQIFNQTDGSSAIITANTADTVTGVLAGGTDNDWDVGDVYEINNSQLVITGGVTVATSMGLLLSDTEVGGTGFKADVGGESRRTDEIILRQNTTYLREFISGSDSNIVGFKASWYEHQDKAA